MKRLATGLQWLGLVVFLWPILPPVLHVLRLHELARDLDYPWSLTCHRIPDRTLSVLGSPMPMCSRCMGIDVGFGAGLAIGAPYRGPKVLWAWLAIAAVLMLIEVQTQESGLHPIWHATRALTGALLAYPVGAALTAIAKR